MLRKILFYIFLVIMMLNFNQNSIAEEPQEKVYHFIFKVEKEISVNDNEAIIDSFEIKTDELGINRCLIKRDGKLWIVTYKTKQRPEDIVAKIQADKFPVSLTFIAYFLCDVAKNKEHFLGEDFSPSPSGYSEPINETRIFELLNTNLYLNIRETFETNRKGPKLTLILSTEVQYPNGCYGLSANSAINDNEIGISIEGISIWQGMCTQAFQSPSYSFEIPNKSKIYSLLITYKDITDKYQLEISDNIIKIYPTNKSNFTILPNKELLRISGNSMWINE